MKFNMVFFELLIPFVRLPRPYNMLKLIAGKSN